MERKNDVNAKIRTILGEGAVVEGDFRATGSTRIDGVVNGNVSVDGTVILGVKGKISGDILASSALIGGEVIGNIEVAERLEASSTARIFGNIKTKILVIDEHAIFQGGCDMNQDTSAVKKNIGKSSKAAKAARKTARATIEDALKDVNEDGRGQNEMKAAATSYMEEPFAEMNSDQR